MLIYLSVIFQFYFWYFYQNFIKSKIKKQKEECAIGKLLNPKTDYVFKRIFGHIGNEEITKDLLQSILDIKINSITVDHNTILEKDILDEKIGILDIKAVLNNNINCDIEVQVVDRHNIEKRLLFYWSKLYYQSISSGQDYEKLKKTIVILFSDYELDSLKEIPKFMTKWKIKEKDYTQFVLTDDLEICIIELPKFSKNKFMNSKTTLNNWLNFINNPEEPKMKDENKQVTKAREVLKEISSDAREIRLAELREKYIRDQKAIEDAGYYKGIEQGTKMEKIESEKKLLNQKIEIAKKLLNQNIDIKIISETTGLSIKEISKLK